MVGELGLDLGLAAIAVVLVGLAVRERVTRGTLRRWVVPLAGLGLVGAAVLFGCLGGAVGAGFLGIPLTVISGIGLSGWLSAKAKSPYGGLFVTTLASAGVAFGYGSFVQDAPRVSAAAVDVRASEVSTVDSATLARLVDSVCRPDYGGSHTYTKRGTKNTTVAAPLVPVDWTPAEPVPAWIELEPLSAGVDRTEACSAPILALRQPDTGQVAYAARAARKRHGLTELQDAPMFRIAPPMDTVRSWLSLGRALAGLQVALWALLLAGELPALLRRRR